MTNKHNSFTQSGGSSPTPPQPQGKTQGDTRGMWRMIIMLLVGVLIGIGIGFIAWGGSPSASDTSDTGDAVEEGTDDTTIEVDLDRETSADNSRQVLDAVTMVDEDEVLVKDQEAGNQVFISRVALSQPGWVAIHDVSDTELGNVLGAHRFDAGVYQGSVRLLRNTEVGEVYRAVIWYDDGDKEFELEQDTQTETSMQFEAFNDNE